jgi:hypothetical protein
MRFSYLPYGLMSVIMMGSCAKSPTEPEPENISASKGVVVRNEDRGTEIAAVNAGQLLWPMNSDLVFCLADGASIVAVNTKTKTVTRVFPNDNCIWNFSWGGMQLSPDQCWMYFLATPLGTSEPKLYRQDIRLEFPPAMVLEGVGLYCGSPDNHLIAFNPQSGDSASNSIYIANLITKTRTATMARGSPCAFSPDGKQLLFGYSEELYSQVSYCVLALETGEVSTVPALLGYWNEVRWSAGGIRCFRGGHLWSRIEVRVENISTGETNTMTAGTLWSDRVWTAGGKAWSPDSYKVALFDGEVISYDGFRVGTARFALRVLNLAENRTDVIAVATAWPGKVAFSGDSKSVIYGFDNRLYCRSLL